MELLRPRSEKRERFGSILTIDVLLSSAYYSLGKTDLSLSKMEQAIEFAIMEEFIHPFTANINHIPKILSKLKEKTLERSLKSFINRLIEAIELRHKPKPDKNMIVLNAAEYLTPREVHILKLINLGLTNKEISESTYTSINTVKWHVRHIYDKLGVSDRAKAIVKSKELGLFD